MTGLLNSYCELCVCVCSDIGLLVCSDDMLCVFLVLECSDNVFCFLKLPPNEPKRGNNRVMLHNRKEDVENPLVEGSHTAANR